MGLLVRAMLVAITNKSVNLTGSNQQNLSLASIKSLIGITNQQTPQFQGVILRPGSFHLWLSHRLRSPRSEKSPCGCTADCIWVTFMGHMVDITSTCILPGITKSHDPTSAGKLRNVVSVGDQEEEK